jgi:NAD kinase
MRVAAQRVSETWVAPAWDHQAMREHMPGTDLLVTIGGDGTVLRAARKVAASSRSGGSLSPSL